MKNKVRNLIIRHGVIESDERILLRRKWLQVCVHSIIYYRFDDSIWTDAEWDKAAREVVILKNTYPNLINSMPFKEDLRKFDGTTGFELSCMQDLNMISMAKTVLEYGRRSKNDNKRRNARISLNFSKGEERGSMDINKARTKPSKVKSTSKRSTRKRT